MGLEKYVSGTSLIDYSEQLASTLFQGVMRDSGLPYTQEHLQKVAEKLSLVVKPGTFHDATISAGWLHDAPEDISEVDVVDPYGESQMPNGKILLNDLVKDADEEGRFICYMVNLVTNRPGDSYHSYIGNIFDFPAESTKRELHINAGILKSIDIGLNINPDERANFNKVVKRYLEMEGADYKTLEEFYKKTRTIDAFRKKKDFMVDVGLFVKTLMQRHKENQNGRAYNNLALYLPLAERRLLVDIPQDNDLFDWHMMRGILKEAYVNSLRCFPGSIHEVRRLGYNNRAPKIDGYKSIRREVREEIAAGKIKIRHAV